MCIYRDMEHIQTTDGLIKALGGNEKVAEAFGVGVTAVSNWKARGIPARLHMKIWREAQTRGIQIDPRLVGDA